MNYLPYRNSFAAMVSNIPDVLDWDFVATPDVSEIAKKVKGGIVYAHSLGASPKSLACPTFMCCS